MIPYTIHIVDDEETSRSGISMALEAKCQVKSFATAEDAMRDQRFIPGLRTDKSGR